MGFNKGLIFVGVVVMVVLIAVFLVVPPKFSPASGSGQIPCGNTGLMYDPGNEKCCVNYEGAGKTQTPNTLACCGDYLNPSFYDPESQTCCEVSKSWGGSVTVSMGVVGNSAGLSCCRLAPYDSSQYSCCGDKTYDSSSESCCVDKDGFPGFTQSPVGLSCCGTTGTILLFDPLNNNCQRDAKGIGTLIPINR
ncbi:MAG: hypothetical protein AABX11_00040 [Nanoarchaeota archaeon]